MTSPVRATKFRLKIFSTDRVLCEADLLAQRLIDAGFGLAEVMVLPRPVFIGCHGWVRSRAWIWRFLST
jgi:hypothetical protein